MSTDFIWLAALDLSCDISCKKTSSIFNFHKRWLLFCCLASTAFSGVKLFVFNALDPQSGLVRRSTSRRKKTCTFEKKRTDFRGQTYRSSTFNFFAVTSSRGERFSEDNLQAVTLITWRKLSPTKGSDKDIFLSHSRQSHGFPQLIYQVNFNKISLSFRSLNAATRLQHYELNNLFCENVFVINWKVFSENHHSQRAEQAMVRRLYEKQFVVVFSLIWKAIAWESFQATLVTFNRPRTRRLRDVVKHFL